MRIARKPGWREDLSGLAWVTDQQYEILGTLVSVRSTDHEAGRSVEELLTPFRSQAFGPVRSRNLYALVGSHSGTDLHRAYRDFSRIGQSESWTDVLDRFLAEVNRQVIEAMPYFGVHAGVVSGKGHVVALAAASGGGKSTLVGACIKGGFGYVSDEALCLDYETSSVVPYPKPLGLRPWSLDLLGLDAPQMHKDSKAQITADRLGARVVEGPLALTDVVVLERRDGLAEIEKQSGGHVVSSLLTYSFNHYKRPADAFRLTSELANRCQGWTLSYDNPIEAAALLGSTFNR